MKKIDLNRAIEAFRWACPHGHPTRHLNGTKDIESCFDWGSEDWNHDCKGIICPRLRKFINILKEPEQD